MSNHSHAQSQTPGESSTRVSPSMPSGLAGQRLVHLDNDSAHGVADADPADGFRNSPEDGLSDVDRKTLPWWKRPSPLWLLVITPFSTIVMAGTLAPRVEMYTSLACRVHRPEYWYADHPFPGNLSTHLPTRDLEHARPHQSPFDLALGQPYWGDLVPAAESQNAKTNPNLCASDPVVQAAVVRLNVVSATSMGILSCLTAAWWGSFSDRHGRTRILFISLFGFLVNDFTFILVTHFFEYVPGGYWLLVLGPVVEGCLGGSMTTIAALHAYLADCTDPGSRSRIFSQFLGLVFIGVALGPTLAGLLIRYTHQTISIFYAAAGMHIIYLLYVRFVIPESLSLSQMNASVARWREKMAQVRDRARTLKTVFGFLSPLNIFIPQRDTKNPLRGRRNWNLTLLVIAYGCTVTLMGSYTYKFQYAASIFGWTSETVGYWLSLVGAARAIYLAVLLPVAIKLIKSKRLRMRSLAGPSDDTEPLLAPPSATSPTSAARNDSKHHSPSFDLGLARISLVFSMLSYICMSLTTTPMAFTVFGMANALGDGFSPAVQSVALEMYLRQGGTESGRLFGALSVIQALFAQIIGPALFGLTYMKTAATFPRAIFFLSVGAVTVSFVLLSLVRLPKVASPDEALETDDTAPMYSDDLAQEIG